MAGLKVTLRAPAAKEVIPGEFSVEATISNEGPEPVVLNLTQASYPSLMLEVENSRGQRIPMPPPPVPDEKAMGSGETIAPEQSVKIRYAGFLDRSLAAGKYRLRYFSYYPALGGSKEEPLQSDWLDFTVRRIEEFPVFEPIKIRAESKRFFLVRWCCYWWHWLVCLIRRILGRKCNRVHTQEVDVARTETMSDAPPGCFHQSVDEANCRITVTVRVRISGNITQAQQNAWETAIENAWSNLFKLCCKCCCCSNGYTIVADIQFVNNNEHQVVNVGATTTNMGNWSPNDTTAINHEFGHMLGALDEYYTVNGVAYGNPFQATGNVMNNPSNGPAAHHFSIVEAAVQTLLGTSCRTVAVSQPC
jgi:hypothetical protein